MTKEKNSMDNFLRGSIGNIEVQPTQSVWKGISKRLIIFELLRLNFTNVSKTWLYSGIAVVATVAGLSYFGLQEDTIEPDANTPLSKTEQTSAREVETSESLDTQTKQISESSTQTTSATSSEMISEPESLVSNQTASEIVSDFSPTTEQVASPNSETGQTVASISEQQMESGKTEDHLSEAQTIEGKSVELSLAKTSVIWPTFDSTQLQVQKENNTEAISSSIAEWFISANYMPEWPFSEEDIYVNNQQLSLKVGMQYEKLTASIGIGLKSERTPTKYQSNYSTYDSVGYFYDIDYFEEHPFIEDSIIIHYTIRNVFDSTHHQSEMNGSDQRRRWFFIPIELGYQIISKPKYELTGKFSATFGWEFYTETLETSDAFPSNYSLEEITAKSQSYVQMGLGIENSFSIMPQWWVIAEPRVNYYAKSPYLIKGSNQSGPFGFGLLIGVKYKFKGRR